MKLNTYVVIALSGLLCAMMAWIMRIWARMGIDGSVTLYEDNAFIWAGEFFLQGIIFLFALIILALALNKLRRR